ncbi:DUF3618 domain-containing protein [Oricola cellulosilytica]|uniref:DUF3618 domain-containing protein n=1 Tax=Oricola cellulosilytica TaxID=1429082 RepID=A0A4R0PIV9_9HYPH|nr:DUF3618 domain-containing protein [Oricola cellulosilytica]TCD16400.1 DUF3618 domain-containing protein [Oricola cellulosilytica]
MTGNQRSPSEIERDIERERAELAASLQGLQNSFSLEEITRRVGRQFTEHGGEFGRSVSRSVRDNPIALALTGVGLAWMIFGDGPGRRSHDDDYDDLDDRFGSARHDRGLHAAGLDARSPGATGASASAWSDIGTGSGNGTSRGSSIGRKSGEIASSAKSAASGAADAVSEGWDRLTGASRRMGERTRKRSAELRQRLYDGTESLSEDARKRVIAARQAALDAQLEAERLAADGKRKAVDFFNDQPLVVGALAVAAGAALGSALPRTRAENEAVGEYRDTLFKEAERIYSEEREKAEKVVKSTAAEVSAVAKETKQGAASGSSSVSDSSAKTAGEVKSAARRVAGKAKEETKNQNLGKPKSGASATGGR